MPTITGVPVSGEVAVIVVGDVVSKISGQPVLIQSGLNVVGDFTAQIQSGLHVVANVEAEVQSGLYVITPKTDVSGQVVHIASGASVITDEIAYTSRIDDSSTANKTYVGKAIAGSDEDGSVWQLKVIDETTDVAKFLFAEGDKTFTKRWDKRDEYNYE